MDGLAELSKSPTSVVDDGTPGTALTVAAAPLP